MTASGQKAELILGQEPPVLRSLTSQKLHLRLVLRDNVNDHE
jgi:hypothetical protein